MQRHAHARTALMLAVLLSVSACGTHFERPAAGAFVGGATGAMAGALVSTNPINGAGNGVLVGVIAGTVVGFILDALYE